MGSQREGCFNLLHPIKVKSLFTKSKKIINIGHININSIRFKFDRLQIIVKEDLISKTKLNAFFLNGQFLLEGFKTSVSLNKKQNDEWLLLYIREELPPNIQTDYNHKTNI